MPPPDIDSCCNFLAIVPLGMLHNGSENPNVCSWLRSTQCDPRWTDSEICSCGMLQLSSLEQLSGLWAQQCKCVIRMSLWIHRGAKLECVQYFLAHAIHSEAATIHKHIFLNFWCGDMSYASTPDHLFKRNRFLIQTDHHQPHSKIVFFSSVSIIYDF